MYIPCTTPEVVTAQFGKHQQATLVTRTDTRPMRIALWTGSDLVTYPGEAPSPVLKYDDMFVRATLMPWAREVTGQDPRPHRKVRKQQRRLSDQEVINIRERYWYKGETQVSLSHHYSVSKSAMRQLLRGATYVDIGGPTSDPTGHALCGEDNHFAKLTWHQVEQQIRPEFDRRVRNELEGDVVKDLAWRYDMSKQAVIDICRRHAWVRRAS